MAKSFDWTQWDAFEKACTEGSREWQTARRAFMNRAGNAYINRVKKKTPVGVYGGGRMGGYLRRMWARDDVKSFGETVYVDIFNNTEYAEYVENGFIHYISQQKIKGQFFMYQTDLEIEEYVNKTADAFIARHLKELFNNAD